MIALARTLVRLLDPSPGCRVALSLPNAALDEAVRGLLEAAGANVVTDGGAHGSVVQIDGVHPFVPRSSRLAIDLVSTGGQVVAAALDGAGRMGGDELVDYWRHRLRCDQLTALPVKSMVVLSGPRSSTLSNQARKRLRAVGHALEPSVLIGRAGISAQVVEATEAALLRHGIVKAKLTRACEHEKVAACDDLAWATGAQCIQRVGRTAVLYRADVPLDPPVKRGGRR